MKAGIAFVLFLFFCSLTLNAQTTPKEFEKMASEIQSNYAKFLGDWNSTYTKVSKTKNYALLKPKRIAEQQNVLKIIKELKALNDVGGAAKYKQALIAYYEHEEQIIEKGATPYEQFTKDTPDTVIKAQELILTNMGHRSYQLINDMVLAREDYDNRNHLEEPETDN